MKQSIKRLLYTIAPQTATAMFASRSRAHSHRMVREWGCHEICQQIVQRYGMTVQSGPFEGLALASMCLQEHVSPHLLGLYEVELHRMWTSIFTGHYKQIIDVGAKFGYYSVGLALRYPDVPVIAFDPDPWAKRATLEMAEANRTKNVQVQSFCDAAWLSANLRENSYILSDCEGYEKELFGSRSIQALSTATLTIETHDRLVPNCTNAICQQLSDTHRIYLIPSKFEEASATVDLSFLNAEQIKLACKEVRTEQAWMYCVPRRGENSNANWNGVPINK